MNIVKPHISSLLAPFFFLLMVPSLLSANGQPVNGEIQGETDGPYVFYQNNRIVVKSFVVNGATCKMNEEQYAETDEVQLQCKLDPQGKVAFSFPLRKNIKPSPSTYTQPSRIYAISDIEGNFDAFAASLRGNGVIDYQFNWTYGDGHLVLVGDFFDRGDHVTACLWLIYKLEQEALAQGGRVHFIIGNHEEMNMRGDVRYVQKKYKTVAKSLRMHCKELYSKHTELGRWLRTRNIVEKIGTTIFTHGGLSPQLAASGLPLKKINAIARAHMGKTMKEVEMREKGGKNTIVFAKTGPMWYRGYFRGELNEDIVKAVLSQYQAREVVVGHTIMKEISTFYDKSVYGIDVKHAEHMKSNAANALFIEEGRFYKVNAFGKKQRIKAVEQDEDNEGHEKYEDLKGSAVAFKAIKENDVAVLKRFLAKGNPINDFYSREKYTLLHFAIKKQQMDVIRFLLANGANPNIFYDDKTSLMFAIKTRNKEIVRTLIDAGVEINKENTKQKTAIYYIAKYGTPALAKMLVESGALLNILDYKGRTPLQYAVSNKNIPVARYFKSLE